MKLCQLLFIQENILIFSVSGAVSLTPLFLYLVIVLFIITSGHFSFPYRDSFLSVRRIGFCLYQGKISVRLHQIFRWDFYIDFVWQSRSLTLAENQIMMSMLSQILNIMYTESVREKEGGTYGVSAFGSLTKYPKEKAVLQIYFDTDPAKRAKMTDIILNELNQFVDQGPSAENLNKVKEFMLKKYKENAKENSYWVNILGEYFWEGTDMNTGYTNTVNSITAKDLQEFTKALLEQNNRVEVSMTSEETK